jgi:hypothetical protein
LILKAFWVIFPLTRKEQGEIGDRVDRKEGAQRIRGAKVTDGECEAPELEAQVSPPSAMVIFGASGDLTRRKLIPALYHLARNNLLSKQFILVGVARRSISAESFRQYLKEGLALFDCPVDEGGRVSNHLNYLSGDSTIPEPTSGSGGSCFGEEEHGRFRISFHSRSRVFASRQTAVRPVGKEVDGNEGDFEKPFAVTLRLPGL